MGAAMLLIGIGFLVLTLRLLKPAAAPERTARTGSPAVVTG